MMLLNTRIVALCTFLCGVFADFALAMDFRNARPRPVPPADFEAAATTTIQNATFLQLIDHENPSLGTFSQFYYYSTEFYKGPGSPVVSSAEKINLLDFRHTNEYHFQVFFTPGEIDVVGYQK
jgi:hypothetical protein